MTYTELKKYYDSKSNNMSFDFKLRVYRAISWGQASENEERKDERIIKLWISFNALYGSGFTEFSEVRTFLESVNNVDKNKELKKALIDKSQTIKNFISIPELYPIYWRDEKETRDERVKNANAYVGRNWDKYMEFIKTGEDADKILYTLFELIYLLRNQIFHGSASYNSLDNQATKQNCIEILEIFIPIIIEIMIDNPDNNWHEVKYKPLRYEKFIPQTKEEKDMAMKMLGWLKKVDADGEYKTPPLSKESRHIAYKILESKGIYTSDKYYPSKDTIGLVIKKK